jgi:hypothetical protein
MIDGALQQTLQTVVQNTKAGASVWTTFRWLGNLVYGLAWVVALPTELVLNRRMGRRYTGILPVGLSLVLITAVLGVFTGFGSQISRAVGGGSRPPAAFMPPGVPPTVAAASAGSGGSWTLLGLFVVLTVTMVFRHRLANWWRFRSTDQVHSFSNGVPFWLHPPQVLTGWLPATSAAPGAELTAASPAVRIPKQASLLNASVLAALAGELRNRLITESRAVLSDWRQGQAPTGTLAWIAATVVHPVLVFLLGLLVIGWNFPLGLYVAAAAIAIFLKARVQKAIVVESVYDLFDARIEQEFTRALAEPVRLDAVERTGFAVPGLARMVATAAPSPMVEVKPELAPEFAVLVATNGSSPPSPTQ